MLANSMSPRRYSNKKIRELLSVSRSSIGRVLRLYRVWGCVSNSFAGNNASIIEDVMTFAR